MKIFLLFTIVYSKFNINVARTTSPRNNLPTHIRENTDFLRQKPRQLLSAEANFEGCYENMSDNKMKQMFPGDKFNLQSKQAQ